MISLQYKKYEALQSILVSTEKYYNSWCSSIERYGEWASAFDILVFFYVLRVNVIKVGNYLNGFINNNTQSYIYQQNPHLEFHAIDIIPEIHVIHVYYRLFLLPINNSSYSNNVS